MRYAGIERIARSPAAPIMATLAVLLSITVSGSLAQARVTPVSSSRATADLSGDTVAKITGGGTVLAAPLYPNTVATFGVNARRAAGFVSGGAATGRISYDRDPGTTAPHINLPVGLVQAGGKQTPTPPRGAGAPRPPVGCAPPGGPTPP